VAPLSSGAASARWRTRAGSVLGVGYATPYLGLFREEASAASPMKGGGRGEMAFRQLTLTALVDEYELPLADSSVDRVPLVHALEMSHDATTCCARSGCWPAADARWRWCRTAAACGRGSTPRRSDTAGPSLASQITQLLRETWFTPTRGARRLRAAGLARLVPARAAAWERTGATISAPRGHIVEATSRSTARSRRGGEASAGPASRRCSSRCSRRQPAVVNWSWLAAHRHVI
jgi:hypothetical protein